MPDERSWNSVCYYCKTLEKVLNFLAVMAEGYSVCKCINDDANCHDNYSVDKEGYW